MTTEKMIALLVELENHFVLVLSDEEINGDVELKALRASVLTKLYGIRYIMKRRAEMALENLSIELSKEE